MLVSGILFIGFYLIFRNLNVIEDTGVILGILTIILVAVIIDNIVKMIFKLFIR